MVNNKIAQRAVAAGLSGLMAFGAAAPAALATGIQWKNFQWAKTDNKDDGTYWKRIGGDTRYDTMKKIVEAYNEYERVSGFSLLGGWKGTEVYNYHSTAVLASGDNFPDALAANGLAGYMTNEHLTNGRIDNSNMSVPVILTKSGSLSSQAKDLLEGMQVQNVIIMGGTAAVSQDVEDAIIKMGIGTQRVAGKDRQETSLKALQRINGNWKDRKGTYDIIIATGENYADALSISPYAYRMGIPIILTKKDGTLTDDQVAAIKDNDEIKEIVIVGGTNAVSDTVMGQIGTLKKNNMGVHYTRIAGVDRYETSAKIAEFEIDTWLNYYNQQFTAFKNRYPSYKGSIWSWLGVEDGFTFDHAIVATGENFPDALVGGQLAGGWGDPWKNDADGVDVEDFDGFNLWSPCPILLTKDGNNQAERIIEQKIASNRVNSNTDTYGTFTDWVRKVSGLYGSDIIFDEKFDYDLYESYFWNKSDGGLDMRESVYPFYVSLDALAKASTEKATIYSRVYDSFTYEVQNVGPEDTTTAPIINIISASEYIDSSKPVKFVRDDKTGDVTFTLDLVTKPENLNFKDANGTEYKETVAIVVPGTQKPLELGTHTATLGNTASSDVHFRKVTTTAGQIKWDDVIRLVNKTNDFYGIILGGTKAVSNDKRDDLDDAVKYASGNDNVSLYDTITLADDWGINLTYSRLIAGDIARKPKKAVNYISLDGSSQLAGTDVVGDVYDVAGTDGYLVRVRTTNYKVLGYVYYVNLTALNEAWS